MTIKQKPVCVTGITARQMIDSVGGSIYIWPHLNSLEYAIRLAEFLGREDLQIYTASDLRSGNKFLGTDIYGITIDHACRLSLLEAKTISDVLYPRLRELNP